MINENKQIKIQNILYKLSKIKLLINQHIPVKRTIQKTPIITQKTKGNPNYLGLFRQIIGWYALGKPDWSVEQQLFSLESIPKLFEYYNLFYINLVLERYFATSAKIQSIKGIQSFVFNKENIEVSLQYEPQYWMLNHDKADKSELINIENWTSYGNEIKLRSHNHKYSHRCPDFVIMARNTNNDQRSYFF